MDSSLTPSTVNRMNDVIEKDINQTRDRHDRVLFGLVRTQSAFVVVKVVSCMTVMFFCNELIAASSNENHHQEVVDEELDNSNKQIVTVERVPLIDTVLTSSTVFHSVSILFYVNIAALYALAVAEGRCKNLLISLSGPSSSSALVLLTFCIVYNLYCTVLIHVFEFSLGSFEVTSYRKVAAFSMRLLVDIWSFSVEVQTVRYLCAKVSLSSLDAELSTLTAYKKKKVVIV